MFDKNMIDQEDHIKIVTPYPSIEVEATDYYIEILLGMSTPIVWRMTSVRAKELAEKIWLAIARREAEQLHDDAASPPGSPPVSRWKCKRCFDSGKILPSHLPGPDDPMAGDLFGCDLSIPCPDCNPSNMTT